MKLSVIIPIYNTEKQLRKCLESVLSQKTKEEFEIICINDGSTDLSEKIVKVYQEKYPEKITYYQKKNAGVSDTRNYGITVAKGEYIFFLDSDDYISNDLLVYIEPYLNGINEMIKFKLQREDENGNIIERVVGPIFEKVTGQEAFNKLAFSDVLLDSPCVYIIKKDVFIRHHFQFKVGLQHEDFGLIPLVLIKARTVISLDKYGYHYIQSSNSITRNEDYEKTKKKMEDVLFHYDHMIEFIKQEEIEEETKSNLKTYYTNAIILKLKSLNKQDQSFMIKEIKKRNMLQNIRVHNMKQLFKKLILTINIRWYLKLK